MLKALLVSTALVAGGFSAVSAQAETLQMGRSAYMHSHHHAAHHYMMTHQNHRHYGSAGASHDTRSTATGGNAGGYADRN
jgi:hypothetical protein